MRWIPTLILIWLVGALQLGLGALPASQWWLANLPLLALIFFALHAPGRAALVCGVLLGVVRDCIHSAPLGTNTFAFAIVALLVLQLRGSMYRQHPFTHLTLALICGVTLALLIALVSVVRRLLLRETVESGLGFELLRVVPTVLLSVPVIWVLRRLRGALLQSESSN